MPYNTRRKSLSLPSLGIHLPNASRSHRSPSSSKSSSASVSDEQIPPTKKVKRSHDADSNSSDKPQKVAAGRIRNARDAYEHTPPPSPGDASEVPTKIDTDGIHDDVVVAAIEQLEKTGNKPHLVRELAAVLVNINDTVANSANPAALLSSRLSAYMKRSWTALSPCPIGKQLINVHPRKVFYYLTNTPHQPLPENLSDMVALDEKRLTPSLSSGSVDQDDDDDDAMARERSRLSPSPEIDLSSPEFEEEHETFNARHSAGSHLHESNTPHRLSHNHRSASPPLEGDEREFTQTASSLRERASEEKASRQSSLAAISIPVYESQPQADGYPGSPMDEDPLSSIHGPTQYEDYFSHSGSHDQEQDIDDAAVAALFGTSPAPSLSSVVSSLSSGTTESSEVDTPDYPRSLSSVVGGAIPSTTTTTTHYNATPQDGMSTSLKRPFDLVETGFSTKTDSRAFDFDMIIDSWSDFRSPETIEVDELDEMFGDI